MNAKKQFSVRVVAKHRSTLKPIPWKLLKLNRENQLTWGVIKFLIAKNMGQFKNKSYTYDIDESTMKITLTFKGNFTVDTHILNVLL